jgi:hypothetical protein
MNEKWVDLKMNELSLKLGIFRPNPSDFFFEPTEEVYARLGSEDEQDLQYVAAEIARRLGILLAPSVTYDWGLKMEPEVAGQIKTVNSIYNIRIPFFYVGKKHALGAILAHEMAHAFLFSRSISLDDPNENELFTDLAAVFIGLGKLFINGLISMTNEYSRETSTFGYLSPELIAYCYRRVIAYRFIDEDIAARNLTPEALKRLLPKL